MFSTGVPRGASHPAVAEGTKSGVPSFMTSTVGMFPRITAFCPILLRATSIGA